MRHAKSQTTHPPTQQFTASGLGIITTLGPMIIKADQKMPTFITQKIPIATTITIIPPSAQPGWTFGIQEMRLLNGPTFCLRLTISQKADLTH